MNSLPSRIWKDLNVATGVLLHNPLGQIPGLVGPLTRRGKGPWNETRVFQVPPDLPGLRDSARTLRRLMGLSLPSRHVHSVYCGDQQKKHSKERWFFINGIMTEERLLHLNGECLSAAFGRRIEMIQSLTRGILPDLGECILGRSLDLNAEVSGYALGRILTALNDPGVNRVIILAHSRGCTILARVLRELMMKEGILPLLGKAECYTFGSATEDMPCMFRGSRDAGHRSPWIEHYVNEGDTVAQLGILQNPRAIPGNVFTRPAKGHFLNSHYLPALTGGRFTRKDGRRPRLPRYLGGKVPRRLTTA